ncbi:DUF6850 family outer membrane beta-barrel protein [Chryseobacterium zhengzhouense]|uniref:DUF6850 family outer membrane beta-barrel protein n=1 Tax=Chryseobacterium zhengzhouense TaxID=1636086 RepID=A0ABW2M5P0_9FLAO
MINLKHSLLLLVTAFATISIKAQDSISLYKKINNQYSIERNFINQFYYNPAAMSGYSSSSFSEFKVGYHNEDKKIFRQQLGAGENGLSINANSYLKLNSKTAVWGNAGYQNLKKKTFRWNENLDYERIAPYVTADSVGGNLNLERYFFEGGLSQKLNDRWTAGGEINYTAQLGYRTRDPRLRTTTSDLNINAGANYRVFRQYEIGLFGTFNKYTQNSSLNFQSILGKPFVYQMVGLGISNYFFSGGINPSQTFEEFGYRGGIQISNKQGKDFYIQLSAGRSNNIKSHSDTGTSTSFEISELENKNLQFEGAKFFNLGEKHRIGLLGNYIAIVRTGSEYGYSVNTNATELIFKRQSYRSENFSGSIKGLYQYSEENFNVSVSPFFGYEEIKERNLYPNSGQKFEYSYFGLNANYRQQINSSQMISIEPYFSKRMVNKSINALATLGNIAINSWILDDFNFQASDISTFGASLRYDIKLEKLPAFFVSVQYQSQKIQKKNNNFVGASLGITF